MTNILFSELQYYYKDSLIKLLDSKNEWIRDNYNKFPFKYLDLSEFQFVEKDKRNLLKTFLIDFLHQYKFITYSSFTLDNFESSFYNVIICTEDTFAIIDSIDKDLFNQVINETKSTIICCNNISSNADFDDVTSFVNNFKEEVRLNVFIRCTLPPIACFLIRRFFYPTTYFNNPSFFNFDTNFHSNEDKLKGELLKMLDIKNVNENKALFTQIANEITINDNNEEEKPKIYEFCEKDFIDLKTIYVSGPKKICLAFHKKSNHIFMMKSISTENLREIEFCQNHSHRCFTRFYGFIKNGSSIKSLIYEFMANENLDSFIKKHNETDELFSFLTAFRLFQGIEYLKSKSLIHRDLKPSNILIDHDFIPYISDFETIRPIDSNDEDTNNQNFTSHTGSVLYSSPEINKNKNISFPTDIYSFGLIVYFLFEHKNLLKANNERIFFENKCKDLIEMKNGSKNIQSLYTSSVKFDQKERIKNEDIKQIFINEFESFYYLDKYFINEINQGLKTTLIQYIFEFLTYQNNIIDSSKLNKYKNYIYDFFLFNSMKKEGVNHSSLLYEIGQSYNGCKNYETAKEYFELSVNLNNDESCIALGDLYYFGNGVNKSYLKAKEYYELAAQHENVDAYSYLADLYYNGHGVALNYVKAKEYYDLAANKKSPKALFNIGNLYLYGRGVEKSFEKAKEYYELSAKQNYPHAYCNLGSIYSNGLGVKANIEKAIYYYTLAAGLNSSDALYNLSNLFLTEMLTGNYNKIVQYIQKAADFNDPDSNLALANYYYTGINTCKVLNPNLAFIFFEKLSQQGNSIASFALHEMYLNGKGVPQDFAKAKYYLELSAQGNPLAAYLLQHLFPQSKALLKIRVPRIDEIELMPNETKLIGEHFMSNGSQSDLDKVKLILATLEPDAQQDKAQFLELLNCLEKEEEDPRILLILGNYYLHGIGVEKDFDKAKDYYEQAASKGNADAFLNLGNLYFYGLGVEKDDGIAFYYYQESASMKNSFALIQLGNFYIKGIEVEKDVSKGIECYKESAEQNNSIAFLKLGNIYYNGKDVKKDYAQAKYYYEKSIEIDDNQISMLNLGDIYAQGGPGVEKNTSLSLKYYQQSAEQNNPKALLKLGNIYYKGIDVERNFSKAREYYQKASQLNNSEATHILGIMSLNGEGEPKDLSKARYLFEKGAEQNNQYCLLELGNMYINTDTKKAKSYYERAANLGNSHAIKTLGIMETLALEGKQDMNKAKEYFEKAAQQGNAVGNLAMGMFYFEGKGVEKNYTKAMEFYKAAAEENNPDAIFFIGEMYINGKGVDVDPEQAINYFSKGIQNYEQKKKGELFKYKVVSSAIIMRYNLNYYRSCNNIGMIYMVFKNDIENANNYFRISAGGEYPIGQINFGVLLLHCYKDKLNANYYFSKAAKQQLSVAEYHLGSMMEEEGKIDESIEFYLRASDHVNINAFLYSQFIYDERYELSKDFIICLTNFKLTHHFLVQKQYKNAKKYFIRALFRLIMKIQNSPYTFNYVLKDDFFAYLSNFILNLAYFRLKEHFDIDAITQSIPQVNEDETSQKSIPDEINEILNESEDEVDLILIESNLQYNLPKNIQHIASQIETDKYKQLKKDVVIFLKKLFNHVAQNNSNQYFAQNINVIVKRMIKILTSPPYTILFNGIIPLK